MGEKQEECDRTEAAAGLQEVKAPVDDVPQERPKKRRRCRKKEEGDNMRKRRTNVLGAFLGPLSKGKWPLVAFVHSALVP